MPVRRPSPVGVTPPVGIGACLGVPALLSAARGRAAGLSRAGERGRPGLPGALVWRLTVTLESCPQVLDRGGGEVAQASRRQIAPQLMARTVQPPANLLRRQIPLPVPYGIARVHTPSIPPHRRDQDKTNVPDFCIDEVSDGETSRAWVFGAKISQPAEEVYHEWVRVREWEG